MTRAIPRARAAPSERKVPLGSNPSLRCTGFAAQKDAALVAIHVGGAQADGWIHPFGLAGISFVFASPEGMQSALVSPNKSGGMAVNPTGPFVQAVFPIPDDVLDLPEAVVAARKHGYADPVVNAVLQSWPGNSGRPVWCTWTFGKDPDIHRLVVLDAHTGERTPHPITLGLPAAAAADAELKKGKEFPAEAPKTFEFYRGEANAWAARWNPGAMLYRAEFKGSYSGGRFRIEWGHLNYFHAGDPEDSFSVGVNAARLTATGSRYGARTVQLRPVPGTFLHPDEALERLWKLNPFVPTHEIWLQLAYTGAQYPGSYNHSESGPAGDLDARTTVSGFGSMDIALADGGQKTPPNRWVWRMLACRVGHLRGGKADTSTHHLEYIYIDAVTGEPLSPAGTPADRHR